jgi:hypothetical protein
VFFVPTLPHDTLDAWDLEKRESKVFFFLSEESAFFYREIFEYEEWFSIPDPKWSKLVNDIECAGFEEFDRKDTFDIQSLFREIFYVVIVLEDLEDMLFKILEFRSFDRESCGLSMPAISLKKMLGIIEKRHDIAPLRTST